MIAFLSVVTVLTLVVQDVQLPPPPRGYGTASAEVVVDQAGALSPDAIARINRIAFDVKSKSGGEMTIVTLPDIGGRDVGDVALRIAREWRLGSNSAVGDRARNAGVVILVVPKETSSDGRGHISIQTGQGTEGFITDGTAGDIRREGTQFFMRRDYSSGIEVMTLRVAERFATEFGFALDTSLAAPVYVEEPRRRSRGRSPFNLLILIVIVVISMSSKGGRSGCLPLLLLAGSGGGRHRGGWGGGGFGGGGGGGGFGGFGGGGGFSGGGSSGSW